MAGLQAKGELSRFLLGYETTFNTTPASPAGVILPINTCGLKAEQKLNAPATLRGRADPAPPFYGFVDVSGDVVVPLDGAAIGFWLKGLLGQPVSTEHAPIALNAIAVQDETNGAIGIPLVAHGLPVGCQVTVSGSTHYNGTFTVGSQTTANLLVLLAAYSTGGFQAETFSSGASLQPLLYTHVFTVQGTLPSCYAEKGFTDISQFEVFNGLKVGKMATSLGGDKELEATFSLVGGNSLPLAATSIETSPLSVALARFSFNQGFIYQNGAMLATVTECSQTIDRQLDNSVYPIGNNAMRGAIPEGVMQISGTLKAMFEDASLLNLGVNQTVTDIKLVYQRVIESMTIEYQEVNMSRTSPPIDTPKGLFASMDYQAFYNTGSFNSAVKITLVNQLSGY
jgi:hypothetical protein